MTSQILRLFLDINRADCCVIFFFSRSVKKPRVYDTAVVVSKKCSTPLSELPYETALTPKKWQKKNVLFSYFGQKDGKYAQQNLKKTGLFVGILRALKQGFFTVAVSIFLFWNNSHTPTKVHPLHKKRGGCVTSSGVRSGRTLQQQYSAWCEGSESPQVLVLVALLGCGNGAKSPTKCSVALFGVGTVLRIERGPCSVVM